MFTNLYEYACYTDKHMDMILAQFCFYDLHALLLA